MQLHFFEAGTRSGSIVTEYLLVLMIMLVLLPVCVFAAGVSSGMLSFSEQIQDEVALQQIRRILLTAYDAECDKRTLSFRYQGKQMVLHQVNDHVILQPGTQIFFSDVDDAYFSVREGMIFIIYERKGAASEKMLCLQ